MFPMVEIVDVDRFVEKNGRLDQIDDSGYTPLLWAATGLVPSTVYTRIFHYGLHGIPINIRYRNSQGEDVRDILKKEPYAIDRWKIFVLDTYQKHLIKIEITREKKKHVEFFENIHIYRAGIPSIPKQIIEKIVGLWEDKMRDI